MQKWFYTTLLIAVTLVITVSAPGCIRLKQSSASSGTVDSSKPLTSSWSMSRVSYEPPFPQAIPSLLIDQIFPKSPVWKIILSDGKLAITYDGRQTWFNPMGFTVIVKTTRVREYNDKSCMFDDVGAISATKLPGITAILGTLTGGMDNIALDYADSISIRMTSSTKIEANISYSAHGTYTGGKGNENFNYSGKLKYTGTQK